MKRLNSIALTWFPTLACLTTAMPSNQQKFKTYLNSYGTQLYLHLLKIHCFPTHSAVPHWKSEVIHFVRKLAQYRKVYNSSLDLLDTDFELRRHFHIFKEYRRLFKYGDPQVSYEESSDLILSLARPLYTVLLNPSETNFSNLFPITN